MEGHVWINKQWEPLCILLSPPSEVSSRPDFNYASRPSGRDEKDDLMHALATVRGNAAMCTNRDARIFYTTNKRCESLSTSCSGNSVHNTHLFAHTNAHAPTHGNDWMRCVKREIYDGKHTHCWPAEKASGLWTSGGLEQRKPRTLIRKLELRGKVEIRSCPDETIFTGNT